MADGIPRTLAVLRKELGELHEDVRAESEAIVLILRRLSQHRRALADLSRCVRVIRAMVSRLHRHTAASKVRRRTVRQSSRN
jgi:DNA invertase Pin-like site-specific DNA recombinase